MFRSVRTISFTSAALLLATACGGGDENTSQGSQPSTEDDAGADGDMGDGAPDGADDDGTPDDGTPDDGTPDDGSDGTPDGADGSEDGSDGGDGDAGPDLAASCNSFCEVQAECLGYTSAQCNADCMAQESMLTALDCTAEGAAENECMATLTCEELMQYGAQGRRANEKCGAAARDYFDACTVGESAACSAMCARYDACDTLGIAASACEESCLLRIANLTWSVGEACAEGFTGLAACIAEASCEELTAMSSSGAVPDSCQSADAAQQAACN